MACNSRGSKPPRWRAKVAVGQDKKKGIHNFKRAIRVPVRLLLCSMTVLYNVNDELQKSCFGILSDTHVRLVYHAAGSSKP